MRSPHGADRMSAVATRRDSGVYGVTSFKR